MADQGAGGMRISPMPRSSRVERDASRVRADAGGGSGPPHRRSASASRSTSSLSFCAKRARAPCCTPTMSRGRRLSLLMILVGLGTLVLATLQHRQHMQMLRTQRAPYNLLASHGARPPGGRDRVPGFARRALSTIIVFWERNKNSDVANAWGLRFVDGPNIESVNWHIGRH